MRSAPGIAFDYTPSRRIVAATVAIALAAAVSPWLSGVPVSIRLVLSIAAIVCVIGAVRAFLRARYRRIAWRAAGWTLVDAQGTEHAADLVAHVRLGPWLVLDFRVDRRRRFRAVLGTDNLDRDTHRRLVLLLARAEVAQGA